MGTDTDTVNESCSLKDENDAQKTAARGGQEAGEGGAINRCETVTKTVSRTSVNFRRF